MAHILSYVSSLIEPHLFNPEQMIIQRGDFTSGIWFIASGSCAVLFPKLKSKGLKMKGCLERG